MSDFESLRKLHRDHLDAQARDGKPGRACTVPAITKAYLEQYAPLLGALTGLHKLTVEYLIRIVVEEEAAPPISELNMLDGLLDNITDTDLRNAVFHIFWHAKELALGRKPV